MFQECLNVVLLCNFVAWISSQIPEMRTLIGVKQLAHNNCSNTAGPEMVLKDKKISNLIEDILDITSGPAAQF